MALSGRIVEGLAKASHDGFMAYLTPYFTHLGKGSFETASAKMGVSAQALAAGYGAFFLYTMVMGIFGIIMVFVISRGEARAHLEEHK